jgi:transcriptional regulator with XRE-family HTH domain
MSENRDQDLGARIKSLREQRSMTQTAFGKALGIDQSAVSRIEDGSRPLTARELASASSALGVTIGVLLGEDQVAPALLRAGDSDDDAVRESLRIFSDCIDEYRGIEALAG